MKRLMTAVFALALLASFALPVVAQGESARVRVVHASPDAPAVDVLVDGSAAFTSAPFKGITDYASLDPGTYAVQVVPAGETEPAVIDAELGLEARDYTVVAVGALENIEPLVLADNNAQPAAGKAHVRFVHASPDAPAVDIAVAGGPVLFSNVAFKGVGDYLPVDAGTYDLEVRPAGSEDVVLSVPALALRDGTVYTVFAMGLAGGEPALQAVPSVDATYDTSAALLPASGAPIAQLTFILGAIGLVVLAGGLLLRPALAKVERE
jgi:hypothetical protein